MTKRRDFLLTGTAGVAAGLLPATLLAGPRDLPAGPAGDGTLLSEHFRALVDGTFRFVDPLSGASASARLSAVRDGPRHPRLDQFSLLFQGEPGAAMAEGIYRMTDPTGRATDIFVIPGTREAGADYLHAEFCIIV